MVAMYREKMTVFCNLDKRECGAQSDNDWTTMMQCSLMLSQLGQASTCDTWRAVASCFQYLFFFSGNRSIMFACLVVVACHFYQMVLLVKFLLLVGPCRSGHLCFFLLTWVLNMMLGVNPWLVLSVPFAWTTMLGCGMDNELMVLLSFEQDIFFYVTPNGVVVDQKPFFLKCFGFVQKGVTCGPWDDFFLL